MAQKTKANISKGKMITTLSNEWASRSWDQRFTSVEDLATAVNNRKLNSREIIASSTDIKASGEFLTVVADGQEIPIVPTNASWNQLCELLPAPANYIANRPVETQQMLIAQHLKESKEQTIKMLIGEDREAAGMATLRAITSPTYGRVWDADVIEALQWLLSIDPDWKVPGEFDWSTYVQNPFVETTKGNTTLFASDRDVFAFLCKDHMPIEAGINPDGSTDVYFPGFYVSNSETGHKGLSISTMMLRGVCANRCLWGVEGLRSLSIRHSKNAPDRFKVQSAATMKSLSTAEYLPFVHMIETARKARLTKGQKETNEFLFKLGFGKQETQKIIDIGIEEDKTEPEYAYDISNAITAYARREPINDKRMKMEAKAEQVLKMVA